MDEQSGETKEEEVIGEGIGELEIEEMIPEWGSRRDEGVIPETRWSITKGAPARLFKKLCWWTSKSNNRWRASTTRMLNTDEAMEVWRLGGCENFVVFDAFSDFKPQHRIGVTWQDLEL